MPARINITGHRFGRWLVVARAPSRGRCSMWLCRCDCGIEREVMTQTLRNGQSSSCGCYSREVASQTCLSRKTHGMRHSPEYSVYCGIKRRCENQSEETYPRYGGIGTECRFISFEDFFDAVGRRPSSKHQIDRIDTFGHYERGNVRWATTIRQARNKRNTKFVEFRGEVKCLADWCDDLDLPYKTIWARISSMGWSAERAFTERVQ